MQYLLLSAGVLSDL